MTKKQKVFSITIKSLIYLFTIFAFGVLVWILGTVAFRGIPQLKLETFSINNTTQNLSMLPSIIHTIVIILISLAIAVPVGVFTAIYLVEYAPKGSKFVKVVRMATETLQGIPSIVFGLFGYLFFVRALGFGYSQIAGALTLTIMILPLIIRSTEEALIAVPVSLRMGSFALGARKLRTIFQVVLPPAMNGIISGIILAIGRIFGETAALQFTAGTFAKLASPLNQGSTLAVFMYNLTAEGRHTQEAYASALVLLIIAIIINAMSTKLANLIGGKNE